MKNRPDPFVAHVQNSFLILFIRVKHTGGVSDKGGGGEERCDSGIGYGVGGRGRELNTLREHMCGLAR